MATKQHIIKWHLVAWHVYDRPYSGVISGKQYHYYLLGNIDGAKQTDGNVILESHTGYDTVQDAIAACYREHTDKLSVSEWKQWADRLGVILPIPTTEV